VIASASSLPGIDSAHRPTWQPDAKDHLVFQWIKFEGKRQTWVAAQLGISQATVSRIVERYERWQAHAREREGGRLDPTERRRTQRWLTYERNEVILASALRIAGEMEGFADVSKSVITRPLSQPGQEREMRTEMSVVDRHGIAARFLRLAFRINMEQLKLVEQVSPPMPESLSEEERAAEDRLDAQVAADFTEAERRSAERAAQWESEAVVAQHVPEEESANGDEASVRREQACSQLGEENIHAVNNLNNASSEKIAASHNPPCTCVANAAEQENLEEACIESFPAEPWAAKAVTGPAPAAYG
jgi:hypothetical protein